MAVDPTGVDGGTRRGGEGWSSLAVGASGDHDTTSLRILADILGYRLKYLRGRCSRGEVGETHPSSADGTNPTKRVDARARERERAVDEGRREIAKGTQMERVGHPVSALASVHTGRITGQY